MDLYVYYRVCAEHQLRAKQALHRLLEELATTCGVVGSAHFKPNDPLLWMEIYQGVDEDFALTLEQAAERSGLLPCLEKDKGRKTESFAALKLF